MYLCKVSKGEVLADAVSGVGTATPNLCSPVLTHAVVLTSARVGVGLVIMLSSMLVATITGLPRRRHPCTMRDCQNGTCAALAGCQGLMWHDAGSAVDEG